MKIVSKEVINTIVYEVLNSCLNDLDGDISDTKEEIKAKEDTLFWFYDVLKDKISDFFDFECEECD